MKFSKFSKFVLFAVVLALLVGAFAGFAVSAEDDAVVTDYATYSEWEISGKNLVYNELMYFAMAVGENDQLAENAKIGVAVYAADTVLTADNLGGYVALAVETNTDENGVVYYKPIAVAAADIGVDFKFVPVVLDENGEITACGAALTYSVAAYCDERLADLDAIVEGGAALDAKQENQKVLYNAIKAYGVAAGAVIK